MHRVIVGGLTALSVVGIAGVSWAQHGPPSSYQTAPAQAAPPAKSAEPERPSEPLMVANASTGPSGAVSNQPIPDTPENRAKYKPLSRAGAKTKPKGN